MFALLREVLVSVTEVLAEIRSVSFPAVLLTFSIQARYVIGFTVSIVSGG